MKKYSETFIGIDTAKAKHAVAVAEGGRAGEVRYLGEIDSAPASVAKLLGKLSSQSAKLHVCYEAGPTGYGLYRQVKALGHECTVVAPSLIPKKPGDRIKTNRRDAVSYEAGQADARHLEDGTAPRRNTEGGNQPADKSLIDRRRKRSISCLMKLGNQAPATLLAGSEPMAQNVDSGHKS